MSASNGKESDEYDIWVFHSLLNDIIPLKNCEIFSLRWYFWNLPAYLLYGVLVCLLACVCVTILFC